MRLNSWRKKPFNNNEHLGWHSSKFKLNSIKITNIIFAAWTLTLLWVDGRIFFQTEANIIWASNQHNYIKYHLYFKALPLQSCHLEKHTGRDLYKPKRFQSCGKRDSWSSFSLQTVALNIKLIHLPLFKSLLMSTCKYDITWTLIKPIKITFTTFPLI